MLTIAEVRAALGQVAVGRSDADLEQLRDQFMALARAVLGVAISRRAETSGLIRRFASMRKGDDGLWYDTTQGGRGYRSPYRRRRRPSDRGEGITS